MEINVLYNFGNVESIDSCHLNRLISDRRIQAFHRSSGWVKVGKDPGFGVCNSVHKESDHHSGMQSTQHEERNSSKCHYITSSDAHIVDW